MDYLYKKKLKKVKTNTGRYMHTEKKEVPQMLTVRFRDQEGKESNQEYQLPIDTSVSELIELVRTITGEDDEGEYTFYHGPTEIRKVLKEVAIEGGNVTGEEEVVLTYQPDSLLRVRPVTRISSSLEGHKEAVLDVQFSPNGKELASVSGDTTVRFWDYLTETPIATCTGHKNWVLVVSWSPDGLKMVTGDMDGVIFLWNPSEPKADGKKLSGHTKFITGLAWQPLHLDKDCVKLVSSSKDGTVRIWDTQLHRCMNTMTMHSACVTKVVWGGEGFIYSSSEDKTIKMWDATGKYQKDLSGHAHWVNCMSLNYSHTLRKGYWDHSLKELTNRDEMKKVAGEKYSALKKKGVELLVSGSDDCSLIIWKPQESTKPAHRLHGHQKPVNHCQFSPNGQLIVSASFDKSLRLWNIQGEQMAVLRGHVEAVYMVCWSLDSRMFVSGSKDSTMKVWDCKSKKLMFDLPGHADEVYALDWSPDGAKVASGGKDRMLRIWQN